MKLLKIVFILILLCVSVPSHITAQGVTEEDQEEGLGPIPEEDLEGEEGAFNFYPTFDVRFF